MENTGTTEVTGHTEWKTQGLLKLQDTLSGKHRTTEVTGHTEWKTQGLLKLQDTLSGKHRDY